MIGQELTGSRVFQSTSQVGHTIERVLLLLRPDGWQARARRNAWACMVADRQRRNERSFAGRDDLAKPALQAQVP